MKKPTIGLIGLVGLVALFYATCTSVITQGESAVLLNFGKPIKVIREPGLYFRFPYPFNSLEIIDNRLLLLQPRPSEFLTADKKNLILENAICYRIIDPILFMKTVRDQSGLEIRLTDLLASHTGLLLGHYELSDLVNTDPQKIRYRDMNNRLSDLMRENGAEMGIEVVTVFIKRIMLPDANKYAVYNRMRAERNRIAKKYLAEGEESAQKIRSEADKTARIMIAEAQAKAAVIRGKAEAEAMQIYGTAYSQNLDFYNYIRSLEAYRNIFGKNSTIILDEKSPLLKNLFSGVKSR